MACTLARAEGAPLDALCPNFNTTLGPAKRSLMQNFVRIVPAVFELLTIFRHDTRTDGRTDIS